MKASIGTIWITGLVITFMLIFTGYLAVTISYSSAIKEKNYMLSIIEQKHGITRKDGSTVKSRLQNNKNVYYAFGTLETLNLFLRGSAYHQQGSCGEGVGDASGKDSSMSAEWYGVKNIYKNKNAISISGEKALVDVEYEKVQNNQKYYYCFARIKVDPSLNTSIPTPAYYRIRLFYALNLPIVDSLVFTIDGRTSIVEKPSVCEIKELYPNRDNDCKQ